jgi:hypothetical protein
MNKSIQEIANLLHIKEESAKLYIEFLTHGELSKKELVGLSQVSTKEAEEGMKELFERDLLTPTRTIQEIQTFKPMPVTKLEEKIQKSLTAFKNLKKIILPQFHTSEKMGFMRYDGTEGIRQVYLEVLEEAKSTGKDIYAFEDNIDNAGIGSYFFEEYTSRRVTNEVAAKVICPSDLKDTLCKAKY